MVTTLFSGDNVSSKTYYYFKDARGRTLYCDALMPAEAGCKYMLANQPIDEIDIIGNEFLNISEDESRLMVLREGQSFYASDLKDLSRYDLLRYRLAEYMDGLRAEAQDTIDMLSDDEQARAVSFIHQFFTGHLDANDNKPNRYFHLLAQDRDLLEAFRCALRAWAPEPEYARYASWMNNYLYQELKPTNKMELSEENSDVRIRFIPVKEGDPMPFLIHMRNIESAFRHGGLPGLRQDRQHHSVLETDRSSKPEDRADHLRHAQHRLRHIAV